MRIKRLKKAHGCTGIAVYDYILCEIYREHGYFISWDDDAVFDVAEYFSLLEKQVSDVVNFCCKTGLFSLITTKSFGDILTSESIQRRYIEFCTRAKRKGINIREECKIISEESPITPEVCPEENRSKENRRKGGGKENPLPFPEELENNFDFDSTVRLFHTCCPNLKQPVSEMPDGIRKNVARRAAEMGGMEKIKEVFERVGKSDFLHGGNPRKWYATFDWIFSVSQDGVENWSKILNGNYDNNKNLTNENDSKFFEQHGGYESTI
jgi:hypothetical protein